MEFLGGRFVVEWKSELGFTCKIEQVVLVLPEKLDWQVNTSVVLCIKDGNNKNNVQHVIVLNCWRERVTPG